MTDTAATAIRAAIRPYSMAVAAVSSFSSFHSDVIISNFPIGLTRVTYAQNLAESLQFFNVATAGDFATAAHFFGLVRRAEEERERALEHMQPAWE
jgi:hypothetical protein